MGKTSTCDKEINPKPKEIEPSNEIHTQKQPSNENYTKQIFVSSCCC